MLAKMHNFPGAIVEQQPRSVLVRLAYQYGQQVIHPVDDTAQKFCEIAGTKTLTKVLVQQIKSLGYEVRVQPSEPEQL